MRFVMPIIALSMPVVVFLQGTLLSGSLPGGSTPNLAFLLTVAGGFWGGAASGAATGLWAGTLMGAAVGSMAAPLSILYGVLGWLAGVHSDRKPAAWTLPWIAIALAAFLVVGQSALAKVFEAYQPVLLKELLEFLFLSLSCLVFALSSLRNVSRDGDQTIS